ncbi:MAG: FAD-binding oxidoreductase [Candidatus Puniceispirillaceae bacterium]
MGFDDMRDHLSSDLYLCADDVSEAYAKDWSEAAAHLPEVVLRPRTIDELSAILSLAQSSGQRLVTQGGRTGLAGGATPQQSEWALTTERMNKILDIDPIGMTITVEAGVSLQSVQEEAAKHDLLFPLDLGARGTATAGGIAATNAGGNQVIHYGVTRHLILGMTAVLPDGEIIAQNNKLLKNNAGFDLKQLMIGTEGTLGVIATITFRLFPRREHITTAFCAADDFDSVTSLLFHASKHVSGMSSFEVLFDDYMNEIITVTDKAALFDKHYAHYILLEVESTTKDDTVAHMLAEAIDKGIIKDALIAQNETQRAQFWSYRDSIADILADMAPSVNFDIGVPIAKMGSFTQDVSAALRKAFPTIRFVTFGHVGDGNLHMCCTTGDDHDQVPIEDLVFRHTTAIGGTITAEHGIGILKKPWLKDCRTEAEISVMRRLKALLDPADILNKGRVI